MCNFPLLQETSDQSPQKDAAKKNDRYKESKSKVSRRWKLWALCSCSNGLAFPTKSTASLYKLWAVKNVRMWCCRISTTWPCLRTIKKEKREKKEERVWERGCMQTEWHSEFRWTIYKRDTGKKLLLRMDWALIKSAVCLYVEWGKIYSYVGYQLLLNKVSFLRNYQIL